MTVGIQLVPPTQLVVYNEDHVAFAFVMRVLFL